MEEMGFTTEGVKQAKYWIYIYIYVHLTYIFIQYI